MLSRDVGFELEEGSFLQVAEACTQWFSQNQLMPPWWNLALRPVVVGV